MPTGTLQYLREKEALETLIESREFVEFISDWAGAEMSVQAMTQYLQDLTIRDEQYQT